MKPFIHEDFMLENETARILYHKYAAKLPIIDYHCHLNPKDIAQDRHYRNITELWMGEDHYKFRAMRCNGVAECYIMGDADDKEKFFKWAETMPYCIGNPMYHWAHLELKRYFGIDQLLSPLSAEEIWNHCNAMIRAPDFSARNLIRRSNVQVICTTDDPADSLVYHEQIAQDKTFDVKVLPAMRLDTSTQIDHENFPKWIEKLSEVSKVTIRNYDDFKDALTKRINYFHEIGCRISDLGFETITYLEVSESETGNVFTKAQTGGHLSFNEVNEFKSSMMVFFGREFARLNWAMQLRIGPMRNNNERMYKMLGPDAGYDAIGDSVFAKDLVKLLNALEKTNQLPKTILYCLNPRDNMVLGAITGCFQGNGIPGKIQCGSGWWFNNQKNGMEKQMISLANSSLLSRFIGMNADSRSFLSFTRHEYFRRITCNLLGKWVESGEVPNDIELIGNMVKDISFYNAKNYFGI